ncbi:MAG: stage II sporulation protein M [Terriglobales bacterium]
MISTRWIDERKPYWSHLEDLLQRGSKQGLKSLTRAELQDLGLLYRQIAADLAVIREDPSSVHFTRYLNQLLARAHHIIYSGQKGSASSLIRFFTSGYPQIVQKNLGYCLVAMLVFLASGVIGIVLTFQDPDFQLRMLGPRMVETIQRREMWTHSILAIKPIASSAIMTNNMSVAFVTFAAGITAGLGTLYMMVMNGLLIGVIGSACWLAGMSVKLWSFVAPHGVLELPAIFIAGGAGLRIAKGLLFPGPTSRRYSLAQAGSEGAKLIAGTVPLLIIAGVIEAFVSPTNLPVPLKFLTAAALLVLLFAYLFAPRREEASYN